jgi:hypothetical protein
LEIFYKVFSEIQNSDLPYGFELSLNQIADADNKLREEPKWLYLKQKLN